MSTKTKTKLAQANASSGEVAIVAPSSTESKKPLRVYERWTIGLTLVIIAVLLSAYFFIEIRSAAEPPKLDEVSYEELLSRLDGSLWNLASKADTRTFERLFPRFLSAEPLSIYRDAELLKLVFSEGRSGEVLTFRLAGDEVQASYHGKEVSLFYTVSEKGDGETLTIVFDGEHIQYVPLVK